MTDNKKPEDAPIVKRGSILYQQVAKDFVTLYRSFRQLREFEFQHRSELNEAGVSTGGEVDMLERAFCSLIGFGIDLDTDDALETQDDYDNTFKEMVRIVRERGRVFCARLKCPFRKIAK